MKTVTPGMKQSNASLSGFLLRLRTTAGLLLVRKQQRKQHLLTWWFSYSPSPFDSHNSQQLQSLPLVFRPTCQSFSTVTSNRTTLFPTTQLILLLGNLFSVAQSNSIIQKKNNEKKYTEHGLNSQRSSSLNWMCVQAHGPCSPLMKQFTSGYTHIKLVCEAWQQQYQWLRPSAKTTRLTHTEKQWSPATSTSRIQVPTMCLSVGSGSYLHCILFRVWQLEVHVHERLVTGWEWTVTKMIKISRMLDVVHPRYCMFGYRSTKTTEK